MNGIQSSVAWKWRTQPNGKSGGDEVDEGLGFARAARDTKGTDQSP